MTNTLILSNVDWRAHLRDVHGLDVHAAADADEMLPDGELRALADDIEANDMRVPLVLWTEASLSGLPPYDKRSPGPRYVLDGRNRIAALAHLYSDDPEKFAAQLALALQRAQVHAPRSNMSVPNPVALVESLNEFRRHSPIEARRRAHEKRRQDMGRELHQHPELSDRAIAERTGTSHQTVARHRARMVHALGLDHTPEPTEGGVLLTRGSDIEMRDPPLPTERVETTGRKARGRKPRAAQPPATPEPALLDTDQPEPVPEPAPPPPPAMISPAQISAAAEQFARLLRGARAAVSEMSTADRLSIASSIISALNFEYQDLFPSQPDPAPSPSASLAKRLGKTVPAEFADLRADLHRYVAESGRGVQTRIAKAVNISIGQLNNFLKERGSLGVSNATKLRQYLAGQP